MRSLVWGFLLCAALGQGGALAAEKKYDRVPFVGCPSDGQMGPTTPPDSGRGDTPLLPSLIARQLAYYETGDGIGILAPRGWQCFGLSGSGGTGVIVTPTGHTPDEALSGRLRLDGPAIELSLSFAGTSGRFRVARGIARLFPEKRWFVQSVLDEGITAPSDYVFAPYPHDRLRRRGDRVVEFTTPAQQEGMGTESFLVKGDLPIDGVAVVAQGDEPDFLHLMVRLPAGQRRLAPVIIAHLRHE